MPEFSEYKNIPLIILSAMGVDHIRAQNLTKDMKIEVLKKPIDIESFLVAVKKYCIN